MRALAFPTVAAALLTLGSQTAAAEIVPRADMMSIGVYYYPEAWAEGQWARDLGNMKKMGFEYTHLGEFAWAFMEPEEGRFDLDWLERAVNEAGKAGLKVILCTPSATPPAWLVRAHPDVLVVDSKGHRMNHGSRAHATWNSETYRRYVVKIDTELARRFATNPHVWGWQIDNELSHYGTSYSYADADRDAFRAWLQKRYPTIGALNKAWGNAFWSQIYQKFDQIDLPNPDELIAQVNPHARLDFERWFAESAADYIRLQAETLRKYAKGQWVTTNYMTFHDPISPPLSGKDLEIMTSTMYPVAGYFNEPPLGFRLGDGAGISLAHDFMRSINGQFGVMELQPGQVNWGTVNPRPQPGAIHMWILRAFAAGSRLVCTYRYRQPLFGGELYHHGIVETDGVTPSPGGREYAQAIEDVRLLRKSVPANATEPRDYAARRTAILYNADNGWDIDNWKQTVRWDTQGHLMKYYRALKSFGAPVDVVGEERDLSRYAFVLAPSYQLVDEALVARWTKYVEGGGRLVLSCRTGQKDRMGQLREGPWSAAILGLIGADLTGYDVLPSPFKGRVDAQGKSHEWGVWADLLKPRAGTQTLATYADQFYAGTAAAVQRSLGKGTVTYVGVETLSGELEKDVLRGIFRGAGVGLRDLPAQFFVDWRDGFWVATNFSSESVAAPVAPGGKLLIGTREVAPAGVAVWTE